ncbi:unnamed protein product [Camellia sinensis]
MRPPRRAQLSNTGDPTSTALQPWRQSRLNAASTTPATGRAELLTTTRVTHDDQRRSSQSPSSHRTRFSRSPLKNNKFFDGFKFNIVVRGDSSIIMKLKVVLRKAFDYVRYDLKEIAFPSSLPDPPHVKKLRKLTWKERSLVLKEASRLYVASWVRDIGPDLHPNDYKKDYDSEEKHNGVNGATKEKEPSTLEDLVVAARGGMETLRPALQRVYMTRASAYRDALKSFIEGYQEGIQQVMVKKEDSTAQQEEDTPKKSSQVLERDLAIFGFFIALGRSTQSFLSANGFDVIDEPIEGFLRYLIGGSVLYYPQLSSISSYQLYVEVVCEELEWLPFYLGITSTSKRLHGHKSKQEGHNKLMECMDELGIRKNEMTEGSGRQSIERTGSGTYSLIEKEPDSSFDKRCLAKARGVTSGASCIKLKEQLKAACSDLERIRRLEKEAEFLEASFRAKAASLQQGDDDNGPPSSMNEQQQHSKVKNRNSANVVSKRVVSNPSRLWNFLVPRPTSRSDPGSSSVADGNDDESFERISFGTCIADSQSNEIQCFELLRNELMELEKRVQRSADRSENEEEEIKMTADTATYTDEAEGSQLVPVQKKENIIGKSLDKLKDTGTDVWQGTQLLAIDVAAAMGLLRRFLIGDELTQKEKKVLQRTLTDLASVVPIGFLMLLPVTAVGHAAMLAAIQRYVPSLIPSTYGQERLYLLRQLEKMKELEMTEMNPDESAEELP